MGDQGYRIGCREKPVAHMTALLATTTFAVKPKKSTDYPPLDSALSLLTDPIPIPFDDLVSPDGYGLRERSHKTPRPPTKPSEEQGLHHRFSNPL